MNNLVVLTVLEYALIFAKQTAHRNQQLQRHYTEIVTGHYLSIVVR